MTTDTAPIKLKGFWPAHMDRIEARICNKLITAIFDAGYGIRVRCGEVGDVFVPTTDSRALVQADTAATGSTLYDVMDLSAQFTDFSKATSVGTIVLIHGNGADIISDMFWSSSNHGAMAILDALVSPAQDLADTL